MITSNYEQSFPDKLTQVKESDSFWRRYAFLLRSISHTNAAVYTERSNSPYYRSSLFTSKFYVVQWGLFPKVFLGWQLIDHTQQYISFISPTFYTQNIPVKQIRRRNSTYKRTFIRSCIQSEDDYLGSRVLSMYIFISLFKRDKSMLNIFIYECCLFVFNINKLCFLQNSPPPIVWLILEEPYSNTI